MNQSISDIWFGFQGRIGRSTYWLKVIIPIFLIWMVLMVVDVVVGTGVLSLLFLIVSIWPQIAAAVKRFHDRNKSGWWVLIGFIPVIGLIWLLIDIGILKGTEGENQFGPDPVAWNNPGLNA
jgi:uncharacterized membrane protein YhaH (DUF805 family)